MRQLLTGEHKHMLPYEYITKSINVRSSFATLDVVSTTTTLSSSTLKLARCILGALDIKKFNCTHAVDIKQIRKRRLV